MLTVGFACFDAEPCFALDKEFLLGVTDYFYLYYPKSLTLESQFLAIDPESSSKEDYFRLVLKSPYAGYTTVKYSDGDDYTSLSNAEQGDINGATCFYVKICYNEDYKIVLSNGTDTVEVYKGFDCFDFVAPYVAYKDASLRTVQVADSHSGRQHISAKSGVKYVKIYTDTQVFFEKDNIDALTYVCDFSSTIGTGIIGDLYIDIVDNAGNIYSEVLWEQITDSTHRNYLEIIANIDKCIEFADENGVGLSDLLIAELEARKQELTAQYNQDGTIDYSSSAAMEKASSLIGVNEDSEVVAKKSLDSMLTTVVADGITLPTSSARYYYKDVKYGDDVVLSITKSLEETEQKDSEKVVIYDVTLTVNGTPKPLANSIAIYDEFPSENTIISIESQGQAIDFEQSTKDWIRFTITDTTSYHLYYTTNVGLALWAWTLIGVAVGGAIIVVVVVIIVVKHKKAKTS